MVENLLVGDVGGTNSTLGIINNNKLIKVREFLTSEHSIEKEIQDLLQGEEVSGISLALAGPMQSSNIKISNVNFGVNSKVFSSNALKKKTKLDVLLLNDFEALGHYVLSRNKKAAVIGAGTGLGKVIVFRDVFPSEGCDADFPFTKEEDKLRNFFVKKLKKHPSYEDLVSGKGLSLLKKFHDPKSMDFDPRSIFSKKSVSNKRVIGDFNKFYGRAVKNFFLEVLPEKIFVAGGIARKNPWILDSKEFKDELNHDLIKKVPISLIKDKYASLKGAAIAFKHKNI